MEMGQININDYDYDLPEEKIAQHPVPQRDTSRLLVLKNDTITQDIFKNIDAHLPSDSLMVFNNSKVIKARLIFGKETGARIEVFCLEPLFPPDYESNFSSGSPVEWKCIVGNLKKWKHGSISADFMSEGKKNILKATRIKPEESESWRVRLEWDSNIHFSEVLEAIGHTPLPPYISRKDEPSDVNSYQTIYSKISGSVAAPTAGFHFTEDIFNKLRKKNIESSEITLHVGAGTFQPVKVNNALDHEMHTEHFIITRETIKKLILHQGKTIAVGTTSVRTLESLYHLGAKLINSPVEKNVMLELGQWEGYKSLTKIPLNEALNALISLMDEKKTLSLHASTSIMIVPGYQFRIINGIITNFHQPRSTLLLLISAWTGEKWKEAYRFALDNNFRFLSYGDSSLLLPG